MSDNVFVWLMNDVLFDVSFFLVKLNELLVVSVELVNFVRVAFMNLATNLDSTVVFMCVFVEFIVEILNFIMFLVYYVYVMLIL